MGGNIFSGHYGRRSTKPYLDQLPRVPIGQLPKCKVAGSSSVFIPFDGSVHRVAVMQARVGAMQQYRFICARCGKRCRILYLSTLLACRCCTDARYRSQSESAATRRQRRAYKVLRTAKLDPIDAQQKRLGRHRTTHWRMQQAAERAIEIIVERNDRIMELLSRNQLPTNVKTKA